MLAVFVFTVFVRAAKIFILYNPKLRLSSISGLPRLVVSVARSAAIVGFIVVVVVGAVVVVTAVVVWNIIKINVFEIVFKKDAYVQLGK